MASVPTLSREEVDDTSPPAPAATVRRRWLRPSEGAVAVALGLVAMAPLLGPGDFHYQMMWLGLTSVALAVSWVIIGGYTGYYSFAHPAFNGLGGYAVAILVVTHGWNPWVAVVAAVVVTTVVSVLIGAISLRIRGPYFSLLTLFVVIALQQLVVALPDFTGGTPGMSIPFVTSDHETERLLFHLLAVGTAGASILAAVLVSRSRYMLALNAIRDDEDVAEAMGVHTPRVKIFAFAVSSALVGLVGALTALHAAFIDPDGAFSIFIALAAVLGPVLGGARTWIGGVLGALLLVTIDYGTRFQVASDLNRLVYGLVLILAVRYLRGGIVGLAGDLRRRAESWWRERAAAGTVPAAGARPGARTRRAAAEEVD